MNSSNYFGYKAKVADFVSKWNLSAAAIVGFFVFFIILTIAISQVLQCPPRKEGGRHFPEKNKDGPPYTKYLTDHCYLTNCEITCVCINTSEITKYDAFNNAAKECPEIAKLTLTDCFFEHDVISNQWLTIPEDIYIKSLVINSNKLFDIAENAFLEDHFKYLTELHIINAKIEYLRKSAFIGLDNLGYFEYRMDRSSGTVLKVEANLFQEVANTLETLQFSGLTIEPEFLQNITGNQVTTSLIHLVRFAIQDNTIQKIEGGSFSNAPNMVQLYLGRTNLQQLDVNSFVGANIKSLDLSNNKLYTFPENIFEALNKSLTSKPSISIVNNFFNCNCDLQWFKTFYKSSGYFNGTDFYCWTGGKQIFYIDINFCTSNGTTTEYTTPESTKSTEYVGTSTTSSTTTVSIATTTDSSPENSNTKNITCENFSNSVDLGALNNEFVMTIKTKTLSFNFTRYLRYSNYSPAYSINIEDNIDVDYLLLISAEDRECRCTIRDDSGCYFLSDLQFGGVYTVCFMSKANTTVPPENCASLPVPHNYDNQEWLKNKDKPLIIGLTCTICSLIALVSGLIVFYTIRQYPKLIKSSKKVIVVKKKKIADVLIMPQYGTPDTRTNTVNSVRNIPPPSPSLQSEASSRSDGYMTPRPTYNTPANVFQTTKNNGCGCCSNENSSVYEYQQRRRKISQVLEYNCIQNSDAPPLPPNHPLRRF